MKKKIKKNKATRNIIIAIILIFVIFIISIYYKPFISLIKSSKEFGIRQEQLIDEQYAAQEIKAKLRFLNTPDGEKHIAKLNGFVEPGEVVIELSEKKNSAETIKPKRRGGKIACGEHTIKGKAHYNPDCIVCQKLNDIYYKQMILAEQEAAQKKEEEKIAKKNDQKKGKITKKTGENQELYQTNSKSDQKNH